MTAPIDFWIYGRVEAAHSPRRQTGYQTLWRSAGVTPALLDHLEGATRCFRLEAEKNLPPPRRVQLCHLGAEIFAVAVTVQQAPAPAVDAGGRPSFVCCAAIYPRAAVAALGFDPFAIAEALSTGLDFAYLSQLLGAPGSSPGVTTFWRARSVPVRAELLPAKPSPGVRALLEWALDTGAPEILAEPVLLSGDGVEAVLREAFHSAPVAARCRFTFSTAMDGCNEPARRFNLLATGRAAHHPRRSKLDVASGRWLSAPPRAPSALRYLAFREQHPAACAESAWQAELALAGRKSGSAADLGTVGAYMSGHALETADCAARLLQPLSAGLRRQFCRDFVAAAGKDRRVCGSLFTALRESDRAGLENELLAWARQSGLLRYARALAALAWRKKS